MLGGLYFRPFYRTIVLVFRGNARGPEGRVAWSPPPPSRPCVRPQRGDRLGAAPGSRGRPCLLRLDTSPRPSPRKCRSRISAKKSGVDSLGIVARSAALSLAGVAFDRAIFGPGKVGYRGISVRSTRAGRNITFLAENTPERR